MVFLRAPVVLGRPLVARHLLPAGSAPAGDGHGERRTDMLVRLVAVHLGETSTARAPWTGEARVKWRWIRGETVFSP